MDLIAFLALVVPTLDPSAVAAPVPRRAAGPLPFRLDCPVNDVPGQRMLFTRLGVLGTPAELRNLGPDGREPAYLWGTPLGKHRPAEGELAESFRKGEYYSALQRRSDGSAEFVYYAGDVLEAVDAVKPWTRHYYRVGMATLWSARPAPSRKVKVLYTWEQQLESGRAIENAEVECTAHY